MGLVRLSNSSTQFALACLQILTPLISFSFNFGKFTFKTTPFGIPCAIASRVICLMYFFSGVKSAFQLKSNNENPIAGIPSIPASIAALIVPE